MSKVFEEIVTGFQWERAPLSSINHVICATLGYLFIVGAFVGIPVARKRFTVPSIKCLVPYHNLFLSGISLVMFVGSLYEVIGRSKVDGITWLFCEHSSTFPNGPLWFYSYLYYLSKYYELADTFLQLFSGSFPPNFFLHVYHHSLVIIMSWYWIHASASLQFVGILFNTLVHVVMYYYYYLRSVGVSPMWKNWVTKFQILQFVVSLVAITVTFSMAWSRHRTGSNQCKGIEAVFGSLFFNSTLLVGFFGVLDKSKKTQRNKN